LDIRHTLGIGRSLAVIEVLEAMTRAPSLSSTFIADIGDGSGVTGLVFSAGLSSGCLIPDPHFFLFWGYANLRREISSRWVPWEEREKKIFWRGSTTGRRRFPPSPEGEADDLSWLPRLRLCAAAKRTAYADRFDFGISSIVQIDESHLVKRIQASGLCRPPVPHIDFMKYQGRVVIDGNANAWDALFGALLMGNCTFLVESEQGFRQWYYPSLQPWEHYVPVAADLSDLDERVEWFLTHDAEAQAIAGRGKELADRLTFSAAYAETAGRVIAWLPTGEAWVREKKAAQPIQLAGPRVFPEGIHPHPLLTHHGTEIAAHRNILGDVNLAHGPWEEEAGRVGLVIAEGMGELVIIQPDGRLLGLCLSEDPSHSSAFEEKEEREPARFEIVPVPGHPGKIGLRRDGLFLCAEGDGRLTLSRQRLDVWEMFTPLPLITKRNSAKQE